MSAIDSSYCARLQGHSEGYLEACMRFFPTGAAAADPNTTAPIFLSSGAEDYFLSASCASPPHTPPHTPTLQQPNAQPRTPTHTPALHPRPRPRRRRRRMQLGFSPTARPP